MRATAITVCIPVRDLDAAVAWYRSALSLGGSAQVPVEGLVEFDLGPFWLQLMLDPDLAGQAGIAVAISVEDAAAERAALADKGLPVSEVQRFEGAVDFFDLTDPDGNTIGFVTELA
jgi:catechol 2,3-dioxygenase-like lactoylglutathione lyase family enzyme